LAVKADLCAGGTQDRAGGIRGEQLAEQSSVHGHRWEGEEIAVRNLCIVRKQVEKSRKTINSLHFVLDVWEPFGICATFRVKSLSD